MEHFFPWVHVTLVGQDNTCREFKNVHIHFQPSSLQIIDVDVFNIIPYQKIKTLTRGWNVLKFSLVSESENDDIQLKVKFVTPSLKNTNSMMKTFNAMMKITKKRMESTQSDISYGKRLENWIRRFFGLKTLSKPSLSDMPIKILATISDYLETKDRMNLRKVSRSLQDFVDYQGSGINSLEICYGHNSVSLKIVKKRIEYRELEEHCLVSYQNQAKAIVEENPESMMLNDVAVLLQSSNVQLDRFSLTMGNWGSGKVPDITSIQNILKSRKLLRSKSVYFEFVNIENVSSFLQHFKAGFLESMSLDLPDIYCKDFQFGDMVHLEQWEKLKKLSIQFCRETQPTRLLPFIHHIPNVEISNLRFRALKLKKENG
ncbi:F-box domain-containing protein [Caenorhabditis elegans]|uniref:F-box domain-containing protein n=1 Tax=Caenorhabditis elegans TaxID=6239 RepID=O45652_CAEEL|nr:F-box domain-containing protein [Caenorhabditis elegans]CAB04556.2 F-box domain-containing protein [Caenorhabditis elegans]|eukprot:NP_001309458.1 F-box A protein [Caenorhabditis elegans]